MDFAKKNLVFIFIGLLLLVVVLVQVGCSDKPKQPDPVPVVVENPQPPTTTLPPKKLKCETKSHTVQTYNQGALTLPVTGKMVEESHYMVEADFKALGGRYAKTGSEGIAKHMERSCAELKAMGLIKSGNCEEVYKNSWEKVWTPAEGGNIGQGSVGKKFNTVRGEMFQGNMYIKPNFPIGTKLLAQANGKSVVLSMGYEIGPLSAKFVGGMTTEAHWYLGASNSSSVKLSYLVDQSLMPGPIECN
jgi:hypothetical protein